MGANARPELESFLGKLSKATLICCLFDVAGWVEPGDAVRLSKEALVLMLSDLSRPADGARELKAAPAPFHAPKRKRGRRQSVWKPDPEISPQPGEAIDRVVGAAHGVLLGEVWNYRWRHAIPAFGKPGRVAWEPDPEISPQPGEDTDKAVGDAHGVSSSKVCRYRKAHGISRVKRHWVPNPEISPQPGEDTDKAVGDAHGVHELTVCRYRKVHGILPVVKRRWEPDPEISPQPGEAPDRAVAWAHGVSRMTVYLYRHRQREEL